MASILSSATITNAKGSVTTYVSTAQGLYDELKSVIDTLTASGFIGDSAEGYKEFFNTKATTALVTQLTDPQGSLTSGITGMLDSIENSLLKTVDPKLGEVNRNPGSN